MALIYCEFGGDLLSPCQKQASAFCSVLPPPVHQPNSCLQKAAGAWGKVPDGRPQRRLLICNGSALAPELASPTTLGWCCSLQARTMFGSKIQAPQPVLSQRVVFYLLGPAWDLRCLLGSRGAGKGRVLGPVCPLGSAASAGQQDGAGGGSGAGTSPRAQVPWTVYYTLFF